MLLIPTPTVADVGSELVRCQLEAERSYPAPSNKSAQNWPERAANLQKRADNIETCMRRAGYSVTAECSAPLKTYESCMKIADKLMRGKTYVGPRRALPAFEFVEQRVLPNSEW